MPLTIADTLSGGAELRGPRRWALFAIVLILGAAVAYHHFEPAQMDGMATGMACLAILGGGTLIAAAALRRRLPRPLRFELPRPRVLAVPKPTRGVPARAGPLYLRLAVLRR